ncbi:C_GCAxxG_C_C family probable redox protein [Sporobacter termitidis DSM 10068]|uniref:C_GCAxxG_C_C family probable redox protein n=1 Tax=Sporobacter termitidis DSM 10068 TaxID=1123282 RepID=A0A1M5Y6U0_9FIRM|nr:C-GCAxxG-C-C family protein [Sporobacter termitidis]SHI07811.1 C_GCAxxG_C_C family probable redox protein [Sporobacter termitidis DSM 10068]
MDKQSRIDHAVETAKAAQIRDDICARSVLVGLSEILDDMPEEMITASLSLAGGTGGASGSCGAYCCGLLAVGLKYNAPLADERANPAVKQAGAAKFSEYRERFTQEMGTILCPELHKKVFGRSYRLCDPKEHEEFLSMPGHNVKCAEVVGVAARLAAEMLLAGED